MPPRSMRAPSHQQRTNQPDAPVAPLNLPPHHVAPQPPLPQPPRASRQAPRLVPPPRLDLARIHSRWSVCHWRLTRQCCLSDLPTPAGARAVELPVAPVTPGFGLSIFHHAQNG
jgi:hypothetical protein